MVVLHLMVILQNRPRTEGRHCDPAGPAAALVSQAGGPITWRFFALLTGRRPTTPNANIAPVPEAPSGALQLGQFTVDPAEATVQPGCRQEVSVVFRAIGNTSWSAVAGLDISDRDFLDQPEGIPYEFGGESCIPGVQ